MGLKNHPLVMEYLPKSRWRNAESRFALGLIRRHPRLRGSGVNPEAQYYIPENTSGGLMADLHHRVTRLYNAILQYRETFETDYVPQVRQELVDQLLVEFVVSREPSVGPAAYEVYRRRVNCLLHAIGGFDEATLVLRRHNFAPSCMLRVAQGFLVGYENMAGQIPKFDLG